MAVFEVETISSEPFAGGKSFGDSGPYRRTDGAVTFAVDSDNRANQSIVDLGLAPRDGDGRVRFRSDFTLLTPEEADRGNGRLIVDVVNRGRRSGMSMMFNLGVAPEEGSGDILDGDGFLYRNGYSTVSIGWQWDVSRSEGLIGLEAPRAQLDGRPIRGQTVVSMCPNDIQHTWLLADRVHHPYPCFASAIDSDGNEVAGIRLPDVTAPVATHADWNTRAPETGSPEQMVPMQGLTVFFPPDAESRKAAGDPRASRQERYGSRD